MMLKKYNAVVHIATVLHTLYLTIISRAPVEYELWSVINIYEVYKHYAENYKVSWSNVFQVIQEPCMCHIAYAVFKLWTIIGSLVRCSKQSYCYSTFKIGTDSTAGWTSAWAGRVF